MRKSTALFLTMIAAVIAVVLPMLFAVHVAQNEALDAEQQRALAFARDVLLRGEMTAGQTAAALTALQKAAGYDPCSQANLELMSTLDLRSTNIQAIGYISGNRLICSSLGVGTAGVDLGPVDVVRPNGVRLRNWVVFPFAPATQFIVIEYEQYAVILNKDTAFVATSGVEEATLAVVGVPDRQVLAARGAVYADWTVPVPPGQHAMIVQDQYVVAKIASSHFNLMAVSAVPIGYLNTRVQTWTRVLVPIGFLVGILLALVVFYTVRDRMALPAVIKAGLKRDEFFVHYQPIVDLRTGRWAGAESLIRWRRRPGEIISPDVFIEIAENNGLITRITERVTQLVRRDAAILFERHPDFHFGINLAPEDLHDQRTIGLLTRLLEEMHGGPGNLMVEATERGFTNPATAAPVIRALRASGIKVAIDDFGTGYSSLASLQNLEVDYLKIDKSFVDTLGTDAATGTVALHIIEMAKALNLEMIAEGVTTQAQALFLRERGVQYAQGWLFAKPMAIDDLVAALERQDEPSARWLAA
jgi:sensor c-di-GMP phosphodiesterase-like protein